MLARSCVWYMWYNVNIFEVLSHFKCGFEYFLCDFLQGCLFMCIAQGAMRHTPVSCFVKIVHWKWCVLDCRLQRNSTCCYMQVARVYMVSIAIVFIADVLCVALNSNSLYSLALHGVPLRIDMGNGRYQTGHYSMRIISTLSLSTKLITHITHQNYSHW